MLNYCTNPTNQVGHCHKGVRPLDFRSGITITRGFTAELGLMSSKFSGTAGDSSCDHGGGCRPEPVVIVIEAAAAVIGPNFFVIDQPPAGLVGLVKHTSTLDSFMGFHVNKYVDYHAYETGVE
jgi:hypothetical protein